MNGDPTGLEGLAVGLGGRYPEGTGFQLVEPHSLTLMQPDLSKEENRLFQG
jgi:hypothetical protein